MHVVMSTVVVLYVTVIPVISMILYMLLNWFLLLILEYDL